MKKADITERLAGDHRMGPSIRDLRKVLPVLSAQEVDDLIEIISELPVEVVKEPETGVIMARARDCFDLDFNLGEVLVTSAEVACNGIRGHATVIGDDPNKALVAAAVGVLASGVYKDAMLKIAPTIESAMARLAIAEAEEARLAAGTKVAFESMSEEA